MNNDRTVALIPVRLTSTRLPEKHLKIIGPKSIISWVIHRLKQASEIDEIVICAPNEPETEKLRPVALAEDVKLFIYDGSADDVVGRLTKAAQALNADICVLASGDCPLLCPETIDAMVKLLKADPTAGHVSFTPVDEKLPIHEGIVISRRWLWQRAEQYSDTPALREHHFPVFLRGVYPEKFADVKTLSLRDDACFYSLRHRISVDTPADLKFMNTVYEELKRASQDFTLANAINLLSTNKAIGEINDKVYQKAFDEASHRVLFITELDAAGGSVLKSIEIAGFLVHHHGIGAEFLVADNEVSSIVSEHGYKAIVGTRRDIIKYSMRFAALVLNNNKYYRINTQPDDMTETDNLNWQAIDSAASAEAIAGEIAKDIKT